MGGDDLASAGIGYPVRRADMLMSQGGGPMDKHVRFGGVRFKNNVPVEQINEFVRALPASKRDSLYEVAKILEQEGMITIIEGDTTTVDKSMEPRLES